MVDVTPLEASSSNLLVSRSAADVNPRPHSQSFLPTFPLNLQFDERLQDFNKTTSSNVPLFLIENILGCSITRGHMIVDVSRLPKMHNTEEKCKQTCMALKQAITHLLGGSCAVIEIDKETSLDEFYADILVDPNATNPGKVASSPTPENNSEASSRRNSVRRHAARDSSQSVQNILQGELAQSSNALLRSQRASLTHKQGGLNPHVLDRLLSSRQQASHSNSMRISMSSMHFKGSGYPAINLNYIIVQNMHLASEMVQDAITKLCENNCMVDGSAIHIAPIFVIIVVLGGKEKKHISLTFNHQVIQNFQTCCVLDSYVTFNTPSHPAPIISSRVVSELKHLLAKVHVEESLRRYIRDIITMLRNHPNVSKGPNTQCAQRIENHCRAMALIYGSDFVTPDLVLNFVVPMLVHQIQTISQTGAHISSNRLVSEVTRLVHAPL